MAAPTQFAFRTLKGIGILEGSPTYEPLSGFDKYASEGTIRCCAYSSCGKYFAWSSPDRVIVIDASMGTTLTILLAQNVFELGFSPLGTFIITWQRPSNNENGDATKNLKVWRVKEDSPQLERDERYTIGRFVQKFATGWNLQYSQDEQLSARVVTNEVQFYEHGNFSSVWSKLRADGVTDFAMSPGKDRAIAIFVPERKGLPASVKVFRIPNLNAPISQKTFFKGDKVQLKWNQDGTTLIVLAQTEVDRSGKSYYGETTLYLMSVDGGYDSRIDLDKDGPIHDVTWSPNSREFGVVYGYMPAKTTLFNKKATVMHSFPLSPRNTILFSPHGRFVLVAGFGNLAGQMDIYDLERNYLRICTIEASNASVCEWSPDGKHILTATTSPRLRVDNGVRIWHIGGGLMYNKDLEELHQVIWRPQPAILHVIDNPLHPEPSPHESALRYLGTVKTPSKPAGAYRPPGARGQVTPLAFRREDEGGAAHISKPNFSQGTNIGSFGKPRKREVPGAQNTDVPGALLSSPGGEDENISKVAAKNKKKREAKKAKETSENASDDTVTASSQSLDVSAKGSERNKSKIRLDKQQKAQSKSRPLNHADQPGVAERLSHQRLVDLGSKEPSQVATSDSMLSFSGAGTVYDKKVRALLKKLRAIDDLKMRRAGGEKLEGTQIKKMDTEDAVRKELEELGLKDT